MAYNINCMWIIFWCTFWPSNPNDAVEMPFQGPNGFLCGGTDSISARWSGCDVKAETSDSSSLILDSVVFFQIKLFHNL